MLEHRDLDHVLVGPGGLFAIETKYRSRWPRVPDAQLAQWAQQAARSAHDLHLRTGRLQPVTPIVVMWGPRDADVAQTSNERDGVTLCAGADLVAVVTAGHASLDERAIESVYDALDAYVRKRTIGEERLHGPKPRPIADHMLDLLLGVFAGFLSIIGIAYIARLEPALVSWPLGCIALIATAAAARRRWPHPRIRALSIGMIAPSMILLMIAIIVGLFALITS